MRHRRRVPPGGAVARCCSGERCTAEGGEEALRFVSPFGAAEESESREDLNAPCGLRKPSDEVRFLTE